jgi:hypothetical protein
MTDTMTSENIDLSSWNILYIECFVINVIGVIGKKLTYVAY